MTDELKVIRVVHETTGLAWYKTDIDLAAGEAVEQDAWPEMENTDHDIIEAELSDGRVYKWHAKDGELDIKNLKDETGIDLWDDPYHDTIWELACEAKQAPHSIPVVIVVRDPDFSNEYAVFGGEVETIDIDLGYADLRNEDEFEEWAESQKADFDRITHPEAKAYIATTVAETADNHGHDAPEWTQS